MRQTTIFSSVVSWLIFILAGFGATSSADELPKLGELKAQFEELRADVFSAQEKFDTVYLKQLKALEEASTKKGILELVIAVRTEAEEFRTRTPESEESKFPELSRLQQIYKAETSRITGEQTRKLAGLVDGYRSQLVDLRSELTKASKIEEATEIQREIDRIKIEFAAGFRSKRRIAFLLCSPL